MIANHVTILTLDKDQTYNAAYWNSKPFGNIFQMRRDDNDEEEIFLLITTEEMIIDIGPMLREQRHHRQWEVLVHFPHN